MRVWIAFLVAVLSMVACSTVYGAEPNDLTIDPHWSVSMGMGIGDEAEQLLQGFALYWPDYHADGAIGAVVLGGDMIEGNKFAIGPAVEFATGDIYNAALTTILPDNIAEGFAKLTAPVRPFAFAGLPFDEDLNPIGLVGTGFHVWPNRHLQPTIRTEYLSPSGASNYDDLQGLWTFIDMAWFF